MTQDPSHWQAHSVMSTCCSSTSQSVCAPRAPRVPSPCVQHVSTLPRRAAYSSLLVRCGMPAVSVQHSQPNTYHAVDALACLCENQLVYAALAGAACEAVCMVRFIARHDRLFCDSLLAHKALRLARRWDAEPTWYEQLPQTGLPSESSRRLVSAETLPLHFAQRKQSTCQRDELRVSALSAELGPTQKRRRCHRCPGQSPPCTRRSASRRPGTGLPWPPGRPWLLRWWKLQSQSEARR